MSITVDAVATASGSSGTTLAWSHTVGSISNGLLIVAMEDSTTYASPFSSVTYGGVALTLITDVQAAGGAGRELSLWYLKGVTAGTASIVATMSTSGDSVTGASISFGGVNQTTPLGTAASGVSSGSGATSMSATTTGGAATDMVVAALAVRSTTAPSVSSPQTSQWSKFLTSNTYNVGGTQPGGTGSIVSTFTMSVADAMAVIAVAIKAATTSISGTGAGAFTFAGAATGVPKIAGTGAGTFTFAASATGTPTIPATGTGTFTFTGTATGSVPTPTPLPPATSYPAGSAPKPFTYCFYDLLSGQFKGTLPLSSVSFNSQLLQPGSFTGIIDVASQAVQDLGPFDLVQDGRTALLVDYLGSFIWGGICWTDPYEQDDTKRQLTVNATELWSWIQNSRVQATDYSAPPYSGITGNSTLMPIWDATLTDVGSGGPGVYDPVLIAWQMVSDALYYVPNANLFGGTGIAANGYTSPSAYLASGTNTSELDYISINYPYSSMQQLGSAINQNATLGLGIGFDYMMDITGSARGPVTCTVNLSYPRRGRLYSQNNLVLDTQRALSFTVPPDATQSANTVYEQGANGALSVSQNVQPLNSGYPILEMIKSRSNIQSANVMQVLQQTGAADLAIGSYPLYTPTVTTDLFTGPLQLGTFILGDDVYWRVPKTDGVGNTFCPRFPDGLNVEGRIIAWNATVADAGTSTLQVSLAEPPSFTVEGPWLP
jgi:hypothetical protein